MADELLERSQRDSDRRSYERLVETHRPLVATVCRRFLRDPDDVDDAMQETFLKLGQHIHQFTGSIEAWLMAAAQSTSVDFIRRAVRERNRRRALAVMNGAATSGTAAVATTRSGQLERLAMREAIRLRLHEAMLATEPAARELLTARFFHKTPLHVLAGELDTSVPTVHRRVAAALRQVAEVLRSMGVAADHLTVAAHFGDAHAAVGEMDISDHGGLRFAPDWRSAELTPFGAGSTAPPPPSALIPGWSRPLRVGALVSYDSSLIVGANRKRMNVWQQVYSTTVLPQTGVQRVAVVEPGTVHRGIVECTLRDHGIIGGLIEADDVTALQTLDVLLLGINWSMTAPIARAINCAVRNGMGLLNEYWTGMGMGTCDDANLRELMLADSPFHAYHIPGQCGTPLPATVLQEHPLLPGAKAGAKITVSGCGPVYRAMGGTQVLLTKDYLVQPSEHGVSGLGPIQMPCYLVGQLGRGRVVVNHIWSLPGAARGGSEVIRHLNVSREDYFLNLIRWLAAPRAG